MLKRLQARQPGTPIYRILWWQFYHALTFVWFVVCYRFQSYGSRRVPDVGRVLLVSNHQSFLDPIIVGLGASKRQFRPLARKTLWNSAVYRKLTVPFSPIPVDQESESGDLGAMKACIARLKEEHAVLLFPEGERTWDGEVSAFAAGVGLIIKRAKPVIVPVALEGAFAVWPRWRKLPSFRGKIGCMYGEPMEASAFLGLPMDEALAMLQGRVEATRKALIERMEGEGK